MLNPPLDGKARIDEGERKKGIAESAVLYIGTQRRKPGPKYE